MKIYGKTWVFSKNIKTENAITDGKIIRISDSFNFLITKSVAAIAIAATNQK